MTQPDKFYSNGFSHIPGYELGPEDETEEEFRARNKRNIKRGFDYGISQGWFESVDENDRPLPFPIVLELRELEQEFTTLAQVFADIGVFPSIGEAKRNGWDKPLTVGEWDFPKKHKRIKII